MIPRRNHRNHPGLRHRLEQSRECPQPHPGLSVEQLGAALAAFLANFNRAGQIDPECRELSGEVETGGIVPRLELQEAVRLDAVLQPLVQHEPALQRDERVLPLGAIRRLELADSLHLHPDRCCLGSEVREGVVARAATQLKFGEQLAIVDQKDPSRVGGIRFCEHFEQPQVGIDCFRPQRL